MHGLAFLQDLAVVMIAAGLASVLFHRLRQPVVLGYILAGLVIGPHTPPAAFIHDEESIKTLAELGILFLMFSLGLEFNLRKLREVGGTAFLAAGLEILLMVGAGYQLGRLFGWSAMDSLFLGAILSISSTTIIVKALGELGLSKQPFARLIFGILIIEDLLAIVMLALLSGIAVTGSLGIAQAGAAIGKLVLYLVSTLVVGLIAVPRLLGYVGRLRSNELLLVTVLGLCFGSSLLAAKLGYSIALGAFLLGAVISECRELGRIEHLIAPIRDLFSAVFFVAIGLLIDPKLLLEYALPIAVLSATVIAGKVITCSAGTFLAGHDTQTSLRVGLGLAQIGEFSFIIAALGLSLNVTSGFLYPIAVAVSAVTTLTTPHLIRRADGLVRWFDRTAPRPLVGYLETYTRWVGRLGTPRPTGLVTRLMRRWALQIGLNLALIAAIFLTAVWLGRHEPAWVPAILRSPETYRSALWLGAVVVALPLFIASFRKLQAWGLVIAELRVKRVQAGERTAAIRAVVAQAISLAGLAGLTLFGLTFSSALLPPVRQLGVLLVVVALLTWLLWRAAIRFYSKAQVALAETLTPSSPEPEAAPALIPAPALLRDANLTTVTVPDSPHIARRLIRELAVRTRSGASIVGLERAEQSIINPGPDEELMAGDRVLLLGSPEQLAAAVKLMTTDPATTD